MLIADTAVASRPNTARTPTAGSRDLLVLERILLRACHGEPLPQLLQ